MMPRHTCTSHTLSLLGFSCFQEIAFIEYENYIKGMLLLKVWHVRVVAASMTRHTVPVKVIAGAFGC